MNGDGANPVRVLSFFLCDDVRVENNNKQLYIGAYSESVLFNSFPVAVTMRPVIIIMSDRAGTFPIWCRFTWPGIDQVTEDGEPVVFKSDMAFESAGRSLVIPLPPLPVVVAAAGEIVMESSQDGQVWVRVNAVRLGTVAVDPPAS